MNKANHKVKVGWYVYHGLSVKFLSASFTFKGYKPPRYSQRDRFYMGTYAGIEGDYEHLTVCF